MRYRRLGRTGLQVSEIGYGAWGIGGTSWIGADDQTSVESLKTARDEGIDFFDTALAYGKGHSERLLARVFGSSSDIVIATKIPPKNGKWPAPSGVPLDQAFPRNHVLECLQTSLSNLNRDCIDLLQFHVWSDEWAGDEQWLQTVKEIRRSGAVRFVGISINDHEPENALQALGTGLIDTVQVIYNIFDQSPEDKLFPYCQIHDIGIIGRVPFDEGSLAGKIHPDTSFAPGDFRNNYFSGDRKRQVWDRVQRLTHDTGATVESLPEMALRFCLSYPAVSTVIPGMRTPNHVRSNAAASTLGVLDNETKRTLRKHRWTRNFYSPDQKIVEKLKARIRGAAKF